MRASFFIAVVLYILFGAADAYTTKRALADPYKGKRLPLQEGMTLGRKTLRFFGLEPATMYLAGTNKRTLLWALLPKIAWLMFAIAAFNASIAYDPGYAGFVTTVTWVLALAQGLVAYWNRRKILRARSKFPAAVAVFLLAGAAHAGTISIAWDAVTDTDLAGYVVFRGAATGTYDQPENDVGNVLASTLTVPDCQTWYIAVKAYDAAGNRSLEFSNEVSGWARPILTTLTPAVAERGWTTRIVLDGMNFKPLSQVLVAWPGVTVSNVSIASCSSLAFDVTVPNNATEGFATVEVRHPDNVFGEAVAALEISRDKTPPGQVPGVRRQGDAR